MGVSTNVGRVACLGVALGLGAACGSDDSTKAGGAGSGGGSGVLDGGALPDGAGNTSGDDGGSAPDVPGDGSFTDECAPAGDARCVGFATVESCNLTADGTRWVQTVCASGSGCVAGACVPGQCSDECTLGAVDGAKICEVWDVTQSSYTALDAKGSLHDRARDFLRWLRHKNLAHGGVGITVYGDPPVYEKRLHTESVGDSALGPGPTSRRRLCVCWRPVRPKRGRTSPRS